MRSGNQAQRSPHAGDLRRRVTISESAEQITGNGFQETMEREVATVWAGMIDGSGSERAGADAETVEYATTIVIRFREGIRPGMKVSYRKANLCWRIVAVDAFQHDRHYLSLKCQRTEEAEA